MRRCVVATVGYRGQAKEYGLIRAAIHAVHTNSSKDGWPDLTPILKQFSPAPTRGENQVVYLHGLAAVFWDTPVSQ